MEVRRDPRSFLFFIILLLLINSPEPQGQQGFNLRSRYDEVLEREWNELEILNRTRYGDFDASKHRWLNISGLNQDDGFLWELLPPVQQRATEQTKALLGTSADPLLDGKADETQNIPLYRNISGHVEGEWVRSPLGRVRHPSDLNSSSLSDSPFPIIEYDRNLTGTSGTMRLHITELDGRMRTDENRTVSEIKARIVIGDHDSIGGNWWEFMLHGVHFPPLGGSVLTTTSNR
jgi:transmembrane E3 ubiquitin-protein ligase